MLATTETVTTTKKKPTRKPKASEPRGGKRPKVILVDEPEATLHAIGLKAMYEAQRKALAESLERNNWNLSAVSRELGMSNASNVIRAIRNLGLEAEYKRAREKGLIRPGNRATD